MNKTLIFSTILGLFLMMNFPAAAQNVPASEIPAGDANTKPVPQMAMGPIGAYNIGVGPINLKPRAYVNRNQMSQSATTTTQTTAAGRRSYPVDNPNSATAYNKRLVNTQLATQRRKDSIIPSPFPDNF